MSTTEGRWGAAGNRNFSPEYGWKDIPSFIQALTGGGGRDVTVSPTQPTGDGDDIESLFTPARGGLPAGRWSYPADNLWGLPQGPLWYDPNSGSISDHVKSSRGDDMPEPAAPEPAVEYNLGEIYGEAPTDWGDGGDSGDGGDGGGGWDVGQDDYSGFF